jgi:hypothetical protein
MVSLAFQVGCSFQVKVFSKHSESADYSIKVREVVFDHNRLQIQNQASFLKSLFPKTMFICRFR